MSELIITAYLCDASGKVIVKEECNQDSGPFPPKNGIGFAFTLNTTKYLENPSITFGYRMVVLDERPGTDTVNPLKARNAQVFFASQEALRQ